LLDTKKKTNKLKTRLHKHPTYQHIFQLTNKQQPATQRTTK